MQHRLIERLTLVPLGPKSPELPAALGLLWEQMAEEKKLDWFFPSCGEGWTCGDWVDQVRRDGCRVVVVVEHGDNGNRVLGFALLAGMRPRRAFIHFAVFAATGLQIVEASKWVCDKILQAFDLDVLIGMIPETNVKAIRLGELIGFEFCGFFPFGSYLFTLRRSVMTQVYCYTNKLPAGKEKER
jgi:hypothetical protein